MLLSQKNKTPFQLAIAKKVIDPKDLESFSISLKEEGKTIASLNGSFDLLHPGHLEMIHEASLQADILFLLLNTDASIQQYKSPNRPILPLKVRLQQIAALQDVDFVSYFDETDPRQMLEKIKPHVHVNGSDYGQDCLEAEVVKRYGGKIQIVKLIPGYSTSNLIKKIKALCD